MLYEGAVIPLFFLQQGAAVIYEKQKERKEELISGLADHSSPGIDPARGMRCSCGA
jgi:hypothetical protein